MLRIAPISVTCAVALAVAASAVVAPAAQAAEAMKDAYQPYVSAEPQVVRTVPGQWISTSAFFDLEGMPDGATWKLIAQDNLTKPLMTKREKDQLQVNLTHSRPTLVHAGPNTSDKVDIRINYPDGSTEIVQVTPKLTPTSEYLYEPLYDSVEGDPGQKLTISPFNLYETPLGSDVNRWHVESSEKWNVHVDEHGTVTTTIPKDTVWGSEFAVTTTYADGTTDNTKFVVSNTGKGVSTGTGAAGTTGTGKPAEPGHTGTAQAGSSNAQVAALVIGLIAAIGGAVAFLLPQLADIFGDGITVPTRSA